MFGTIPKDELASNRSLSLCYADIPDQMVTDAVDAIISRMAPAYLELIREAKDKPEIISDYKSSLRSYYEDRSLIPEIRSDVEAQGMASDCFVVTEGLNSDRRISVFSEKNSKFDENQPMDKSRFYIRLNVNAKDIEDKDPLDHLLSELSKKILSLGYGSEGTFDIRLEKGFLSLEGNPWKWHYDGEILKTSVTVCYSNKKNWSTRVANSQMESIGRAADHGFLYDALHVYHRAPLPSDLEGEELIADDYRLFIRYQEFYTKSERPQFPNTNGAKKEERKILPLLPNYQITELVRSLSKEQSSTPPLLNLLGQKNPNHSSAVLANFALNSIHVSHPELHTSKLLLQKAPDAPSISSLLKQDWDAFLVAEQEEKEEPPKENKSSLCIIV